MLCVCWVGLCVFAVVIRVCLRLLCGCVVCSGLCVGVFRVVCEMKRGVGGGAKGSKEHERVPLFQRLYPPPPCLWCGCGGFLLSHTLSGAVPSALLGLASGFGMLPGVSPIL